MLLVTCRAANWNQRLCLHMGQKTCTQHIVRKSAIDYCATMEVSH